MTRLEYELIREQHPELNLPTYMSLDSYCLSLLDRLSRDRLIARRTAVILSREDVRVMEPSYYRFPDEV